jgi:general secretion pathway protein L
MSLRRIIDSVTYWIELVAQAIVGALGRLRPARRAQLIEQDDGAFALRLQGRDAKAAATSRQLDRHVFAPDPATPAALPADVAASLRGSHVELVLRDNRFLFRPLELPKRASEFLDGIVRSQIDRLTPWSAADAVFGWAPPVDTSGDRIALTVVATARARIAPYVQALTGIGASSIVITTQPHDGSLAHAGPITVFAQGTRGALDIARVSRMLFIVLTVASLTTALAATTAQFLTDGLDTQQLDLTRRIAERRAMLINGRNTGRTSARQTLEKRKHETAPNVMVLEALTRVLPDHTYLVELRAEGDKLQIIGITREAPSLIRLIEQSPYFTRATFFAPTTRSPDDPGERFHIEARINPIIGSGL